MFCKLNLLELNHFDTIDDYYDEDMRSRERTFSEGSALKGRPPPKESYNIRRRNISPNSPSYDGFDDVKLDDNESLDSTSLLVLCFYSLSC